jgi:hypothetical protein
MQVAAVDWSGAATGASTHIWLARVADGELVELSNGRSRDEVVDALVALRAACPEGLVVGLDFSFSFPAWFVEEQSCTTIDDVWQTVARKGEDWLRACAPPFWGRPGRRRPGLVAHLRRAEEAIAVGGIRPKSIFQIGGAGSVGTGSLRGMPHLPRLRAAGYSIWPFDPIDPLDPAPFDPAPRFMVFEMYPRLFTGPVHKSDPLARARHWEQMPWQVSPAFARSIVASEDAFDAAISALALYEHRAELATLAPSSDPVTLLEGDVWSPFKIEP